MSIETNDPIYDFHWPHLLLYSFITPKTKNDIITIPVFTYKDPKKIQTIKYGGRDVLELNGKKYKAQIWETTNSLSGTNYTYWIDLKSNTLLQSKSVLKDGTIFWFRLKALG